MKQHFFKLDWLSFTFSYRTLENAGIDTEQFNNADIDIVFKHIFPEFDSIFGEMVQLEHGRFGYKEVFCFNNEFMIMTSNDNQDLGIFVTVPSHGLYRLGEVFNLPDFNDDYYDTQQMFQTLISRGAKFTRLDICYDDYNKYLSPYDWNNLFASGNIDTRVKFHSFIGSRTGGTFYLGKRGRSRMLRVYDKAGESNGEIDAIRYELEMSHDYAMNFAANIAQGNKLTFLDILDSFCCVKKYSLDEIRDNDVVYQQKWWQKKRVEIDENFQKLRDDILNSAQNTNSVPITIVKSKKYYDVFRSRAWIDNVSKVLYKHVSIFGYEDLIQIIDKARDKLNREDIEHIKRNLDLVK